MAKRQRDVVGVVGDGDEDNAMFVLPRARIDRRPEGDPEVDEQAESQPSSALDSFLAEVFQDTTQSNTASGPETPGDGGDRTSLGFLKDNFKTKSAAIRYLHSLDWETKRISKHLGLRYQQVRNVLTTELKRGPNEDFHLEPGENGSKSNQF